MAQPDYTIDLCAYMVKLAIRVGDEVGARYWARWAGRLAGQQGPQGVRVRLARWKARLRRLARLVAFYGWPGPGRRARPLW